MQESLCQHVRCSVGVPLWRIDPTLHRLLWEARLNGSVTACLVFNPCRRNVFPTSWLRGGSNDGSIGGEAIYLTTWENGNL